MPSVPEPALNAPDQDFFVAVVAYFAAAEAGVGATTACCTRTLSQFVGSGCGRTARIARGQGREGKGAASTRARTYLGRPILIVSMRLVGQERSATSSGPSVLCVASWQQSSELYLCT